MPQVIVTNGAVIGLEKCRGFLISKNPLAAKKAANLITTSFNMLENNPEIGRHYEDIPGLRELIIDFGSSGYVALYRYISSENIVYILAFKHQKELDF